MVRRMWLLLWLVVLVCAGMGGVFAQEGDEGITIVTPVTGELVFMGTNPNFPNAISLMLDTSSGELQSLLTGDQVDGPTGNPIWSSDGRYIAYYSYFYPLTVYDTLTSTLVSTNLIAGRENTSFYPVGWSSDNTQLLVKAFNFIPSITSSLEILDISTLQTTSLLSVTESQSIAGLLQLPPNATDVQALRIHHIHWNPVHDQWISFLIDVLVTDSTGEVYGDTLAYIYNYQTQQSSLINSGLPENPRISSMTSWDEQGTQLAINGRDTYIVEVENLATSPTINVVQSTSETYYQVALEWLDVSDILIAGYLTDTGLNFYLAQIIENQWHYVDFLEFSKTEFPLMSDAIAWNPTFTDEEAHQLSCLFDQALPTQLSIGARARVNFTDGTPLRLRDAPSFDANEITQMPEGTEFDIIGGKACMNGESYMRFWEMKLDNGTTGWAAEADTNEYFMETVE